MKNITFVNLKLLCALYELTVLNSFPFAIAQECAESAGVQMVQYGDKEVIVEFKSVRKLLCYLPNAVNKLQKHRRSIRV